MKKPETPIKDKIFKFVSKEIGGKWFKISGSVYQDAGIPDIIGCVPFTMDNGSKIGIFVSIEVKTDEGKVRKLQSVTISEIEEKGHGIALVMRSLEVKDKIMLKTLLNLKPGDNKAGSLGKPESGPDVKPSGGFLDAYLLYSDNHIECQGSGHGMKEIFAKYFIPKFRLKFLCAGCVKKLDLKIKTTVLPK
jgi:hypothetical protein